MHLLISNFVTDRLVPCRLYTGRTSVYEAEQKRILPLCMRLNYQYENSFNSYI